MLKITRVVQLASLALGLAFASGGCGESGASSRSPSPSASSAGPAPAGGTASATGTAPAGRVLLAFCYTITSGEVAVFDVTRGALLPTPDLNRPGEKLILLDMSADGGVLLGLTQFAGETILYDLRASRRIALPGLAGWWGLNLSPDGRYIYAQKGANGATGLYDRDAAAMLPAPAGVQSMSRDARRMAFLDRQGGLAVFDRTAGRAIFDAWSLGGYSFERPRLTEDGRYLYFGRRVHPGNRSEIVLFDLDAQAQLALPGIQFPNVSLHVDATSADGRFVAIEGAGAGGPFDADNKVALYDASSAILAYLPLPGLGVATGAVGFHSHRLAVSGDGRYLAGVWRSPSTTIVERLHLYDRQAGALLPLPGVRADEAYDAIMRP